jgi:ketopantoate hydroxymethyltransferase
MLTSHDTLTAGVFERAGVRAILVGDTSGELVLGYSNTVPVTTEHLIPMVQAVVRPRRVGRTGVRRAAIPTVGIGAGAQCDAQIMGWQDLAGLTTGHAPKFVKRFADLAATQDTAVRQYVSEVAESSYPDDQHSYV